ncbi:hypothetical protein Tco_0478484 [Tanacetum coccineum]
MTWIKIHVYNVWHERNCRIFKNECRDKKVITKLIVDDVRSRLMTLKTRKSNAVNVAAKDWEVATQIDNSLYIGVLLGSWPGWTTYAEGNRVCVKDEPSWSSQYVVKGVGRMDRLWNELWKCSQEDMVFDAQSLYVKDSSIVKGLSGFSVGMLCYQGVGMSTLG